MLDNGFYDPPLGGGFRVSVAQTPDNGFHDPPFGGWLPGFSG